MQTYGIAFSVTPKGAHKAKIGPVEVDAKGEEKVVATLVSEPFHEAKMLAAAVSDILSMAPAIKVVGEAPDGWLVPEPAAFVEADVPAQLFGFDGVAFDRRQLALMVSLERKWGPAFAARGASRLWGHLSEGKTIEQAAAEVNRTMQMKLTPGAAYDLAQRELYRLCAHVAIVANRDLMPRSPDGSTR
jgi:hypothetical protein